MSRRPIYNTFILLEDIEILGLESWLTSDLLQQLLRNFVTFKFMSWAYVYQISHLHFSLTHPVFRVLFDFLLLLLVSSRDRAEK